MATVTYNITNNNMQQQSDFLNYYLTMNMNNICRICLEKGSRLMPIFDPVKPPHFPLLIMACAAVQVSFLSYPLKKNSGEILQVLQGDGLPPYICQKCVSRLNIAFQFKTQCESSDAKLRQCFEHFHNLPPTPDLTGFIELKKDDGSGLALFTQNNEEGTDNVETSEIQIHPQIQTTELENENILDSTETQILVQMEANSSLFNIDEKTVMELKPELEGMKLNLNIKVSTFF